MTKWVLARMAVRPCCYKLLYETAGTRLSYRWWPSNPNKQRSSQLVQDALTTGTLVLIGMSPSCCNFELFRTERFCDCIRHHILSKLWQIERSDPIYWQGWLQGVFAESISFWSHYNYGVCTRAKKKKNPQNTSLTGAQYTDGHLRADPSLYHSP